MNKLLTYFRSLDQDEKVKVLLALDVAIGDALGADAEYQCFTQALQLLREALEIEKVRYHA